MRQFSAEIITLALHVDYWNSVVWKDAYSSPLFSRRQQLYSQALKSGENYTPQMVVDGRAAFIGSNLAKAQKNISEAAKMPKAAIVITSAADALKIGISDVPVHENATVFLALTEDDLASNRKNGLQSDKNLKYISVVRSLTTIGAMSAAQTDLQLQTVLPLQPEWKREQLKIVVFVQENASRKILGVNRIILN
ncbi:MAG: DUF1223 domain-containing protein [Acidobacteriota bacterium]|nr:DUF1223 domain-containing protein [Acidobacteriota bacterium]